jgi:hypothetical protein
MAKVSRKTALIVALMLAVTATVLVIGPAVQAANTDVSISNYSQCTDGTADDDFKACTGWINGILNAQNSTYHEDEVTPQRLLLKVPKGAGLDHSLDLTYLTRKGSAQAHAYDSLATWNFTQTAAERCQSLQNCPSGSAFEFDIPSDPTDVPPTTTQGGDASTALRELPQDDRKFQFFGPVLTADAPGPITHDSAASASTDDYATLTVNYALDPSVVDTDGDGLVDATTYVQLVFGGHLAASAGSRSWGAGLGAANINGGPYHIRVTKIDATAIGNRDNQITSGAILPITSSTLTELHQTDGTDTGTDVDPENSGTSLIVNFDAGDTVYVTDFAFLTPDDATGTVAFRYYTGDNALTDCASDVADFENGIAPTRGTDAGGSAVSGGEATSTEQSFTSAGTFYWEAFFDGTDLSVDSTSECGAELLTINQNATLATAPSLIPQDSATLDGILAGGTTPATLTFTLYGPDANGNSDCTGPVLFSDQVDVTVDDTYTTANSGDPSTTPSGFSLTSDSDLGIYSWVVSYSGDEVNDSITSACGVESFDFRGITDDPPVVP